jgi:hypothetical protein
MLLEDWQPPDREIFIGELENLRAKANATDETTSRGRAERLVVRPGTEPLVLDSG